MKRNVLIFTMLFTISLFTMSCSKEDVSEGPEGLEQGIGEGTEGNHNETGGNEQGESGVRWQINQTADETINGIRAIISYNVTTNAFEGTFENLNSNVAEQTRLEAHVFDANGNSTEFGPTPGIDMQPGETRNVTLTINATTSFVEFTMHPEVGVSGNGG